MAKLFQENLVNAVAIDALAPSRQQPWIWLCRIYVFLHYSAVIMGAMASQITSLTIVSSTVYSGADLRRHQSSLSLAFVRGIHRWPVNSPHKGSVTRKIFPFYDVIMIYHSMICKFGLQCGNAKFGQNWGFFCPVWPWNFGCHWKNDRAHLLYATQTLCIISLQCVNSNWSYGPETAKLGFHLCDIDFLPLTLTSCMDITSVNGTKSRKFDVDTMMGT